MLELLHSTQDDQPKGFNPGSAVQLKATNSHYNHQPGSRETLQFKLRRYKAINIPNICFETGLKVIFCFSKCIEPMHVQLIE